MIKTLNQKIASARVIVPEFSNIQSMCDLSPTDGWKKWKDDQGNILTISKNNSVRIFKSNKETHTTRDILAKAEPNRISRFSYYLVAMFEKDRVLLVFMGNDGILRTCEFEKDIWLRNHKPLLLGLECLKQISNDFQLDGSSRWKVKLPIKQLEFEPDEVWSTSYPEGIGNELQRRIAHLL